MTGITTWCTACRQPVTLTGACRTCVCGTPLRVDGEPASESAIHQAVRLVDEIVALAFGSPRMPRSGAYVAGVRDHLRARALSRQVLCPYPQGSAEADAWFAGVDEGRVLWREELARQAAASSTMQQALSRAAASRRPLPPSGART